MILKFYNGHNEREIGRPLSEEEAYSIMDSFMKKHGFKCYYTRSWGDIEKRMKIYDVGSWSEFFHLYLEDGEDELLIF